MCRTFHIKFNLPSNNRFDVSHHISTVPVYHSAIERGRGDEIKKQGIKVGPDSVPNYQPSDAVSVMAPADSQGADFFKTDSCKIGAESSGILKSLTQSFFVQ